MPGPGPLTHNAIHLLNNGGVNLRPKLQVLDIKKVGNSTQDRFRLILSDGVYVQQAILVIQLNDYINSNRVRRGTIVELLECMIHIVQGLPIIIVEDMKVVQSEAEIIGDPEVLPAGSGEVGGGGQQQPRTVRQQHRVNQLVSECLLIFSFLLLLAMHLDRAR